MKKKKEDEETHVLAGSRFANLMLPAGHVIAVSSARAALEGTEKRLKCL